MAPRTSKRRATLAASAACLAATSECFAYPRRAEVRHVDLDAQSLARLGARSRRQQCHLSILPAAFRIRSRVQPITRAAIGDGVSEVYTFCLWATGAAAASLMLYVRPWGGFPVPGSLEPGESGKQLSSLACTFLPAWLLAVSGDWLQGPYVYALYESYGLPRADIALLFVAGFGSSMAFGTVVGSWADQIGRKRGCQLYCVLYIVSCLTKHFANFWVLLLGRFTGGIATSLLFSAFEAWLIREHEVSSGKTPQMDLRRLFGLMWFGSSLVAIAAGPAGDLAVGLLPATEGPGAFRYGGLASAFDLAILLLTAGLVLLSVTWQENVGEKANAEHSVEGKGPLELLADGAKVIGEQPPLLALMAVVAGFEGALYGFVFNWTSALEEGAVTPPALGSIFATLMLAYTAGSLVFQLLGPERGKGEEASSNLGMALPALRTALAIAPFALVAPALALSLLPAGSAERTALVLGGFVLFEFCCGLYAPAVSAVKSALVPESLRSTIYNTYRVPMNGVVLGVLLWGAPPATALPVCAALVAAAAAAASTLPSSGSDGGSAVKRQELVEVAVR